MSKEQLEALASLLAGIKPETRALVEQDLVESTLWLVRSLSEVSEEAKECALVWEQVILMIHEWEL